MSLEATGSSMGFILPLFGSLLICLQWIEISQQSKVIINTIASAVVIVFCLFVFFLLKNGAARSNQLSVGKEGGIPNSYFKYITPLKKINN